MVEAAGRLKAGGQEGGQEGGQLEAITGVQETEWQLASAQEVLRVRKT